MIRILILFSMCNLLSMNDMLSCEIFGVFKLKKTFITTYSRGNAKNTREEELYFVVTKALENDFANVYACGIFNSKAPLYKKQAPIHDSINFQSFRAFSQCSHIMKENKLLKNNEIHDNCPVNKFFENRDTLNPFMSLSLNDNHIVSSNNSYTLKMVTSIEKTNWSDKYVNNLSLFVQRILKSELPKVQMRGGDFYTNPNIFDDYSRTDEVLNSFINQNLPIGGALRGIRPDFQLTTKYLEGRNRFIKGYDTLFKWNLDKCILIEDAILGRYSGLLVDLYSREKGTYTEVEFAKLKHIINKNKMKYKSIDTLIQLAKQIVINEDKIDTTLINFQNMLSNTIAVKKKVQDFKSDIFNTFLSSPLLITSFDEKPKVDDTLSLFISVRNKIRKEYSTTTYASMIDSNFYAFYYRGILDYDERNSNYEYTESKIIPVKNLLDTLKLMKQKYILLLDDIPSKVDKSTEQIRAHIKYYHQNFKKLYNTVKTNVYFDNNINIYLTKFDSLLLDLESKCEVPKFVSYSNYSIKKPFNSLEAYRLHKFILNRYENSLPSYWGGSFELNEMEKIKNEGYYEYKCRINYSPYQEIAPMLLAYNKEFSKQSPTLNRELIFENNLGKLGYILGLDSNQFKLDILHYFKECEFNGPTLNFFDETNNIAFSWGFENTKTKDSIALLIAKIDSLLNNNISDISKQIDYLKIKNSGVDHKIQINMLEYKPYCAFVNYYQLQKPDIVLDELSKQNVELSPQKIDSIYQHYRKEDNRLKELEKKSIFTVFRDDKTVRTSPVLDLSDKRLQLIRSFIIDSINTLKKIKNANYLDEIYYTYLPNDIVKKMILDSLRLLYKKLDSNINRFIYPMDFSQDLSLPRPSELDFMSEDSLYANILRIRSKYFKIFDEYALNFISIDTVSKNLITNIPRVPLTNNICDVATLYNKSKGFGSEWNLKSDSLIVESLGRWLKYNRYYGQGNLSGGYRSEDMRYDVDRNQWIVQFKDVFCERERKFIYMLFKLNDIDFDLTSLFIDL